MNRRWLALAGCLLLILQTGVVFAMTVNVFGPYSPEPSGPRSHDVVFYAENQPNFLFDHGSSVVITCQSIKRPQHLTWSLSRNLIRTPFLSGEADPRLDDSFRLEVPTAALRPGFYELHVKLIYTATQSAEAVTAFGWKINEEPVITYVPRDFMEFWQGELKKMADVPLDLKIEKVGVLSDAEVCKYNLEHASLVEYPDPAGEKVKEVELYKVNFAGANGTRVYAWVAKPVGPGPFPTMLVLPGAGTGPRPQPLEHARHGYVAMEVQMHNQPVDMAREKYPPTTADDYSGPRTLDEYHVYLNAVRAVTAICACPGADPSRLVTMGGSQGGRLSIVVPALCPQVKATIPHIAHFAYMPWLRWTERMNLAKESGEAGFTAKDLLRNDQTRAEGYFDILNFAPYIKCPVYMDSGLIDGASPPTGCFAVYRALNCPKTMSPLPNKAHDNSPCFDRAAWRWLDKLLK
ncbi:MAG TPA: acetylxylan esterase [Armatimonadota bacterium]|jgi:cephalosporin-C deacetylase